MINQGVIFFFFTNSVKLVRLNSWIGIVLFGLNYVIMFYMDKVQMVCKAQFPVLIF